MAVKVHAGRETVSLIGSDKVEGTAVYGADGALARRRVTAINRQNLVQTRNDPASSELFLTTPHRSNRNDGL